MSSTSSTHASRLMMQVLIIALLTAAVYTARTVISKEKLHPPLPLTQQLRIWQCRQRCYHQIPLQPTVSPAQCHARPDCYMCHDYCRVLVVAEWSLARSMCADRIFCSRGCRTACQFHRLNTFPMANALNKAT